MRNKRIYIKSIAISEKDLKYIKSLKFSETKSLAGNLSYIINLYKKSNKSTDLK